MAVGFTESRQSYVSQGWVVKHHWPFEDKGRIIMQRLLLIAWAIAIGSIVMPQSARADHYTDEQVLQAIYAAAAEYGQDPVAMERVARCESELNEHAYNNERGEMGIFQFHPGTWTQTPFAGTDPYDPWNNAKAAGWMWAQGRKDSDWVCK